MAERFLTETEVSDETRISINTLRWYRHKGEGGPAHFKLGRRVLYAREDVERWIEQARAGDQAKAGGAA